MRELLATIAPLALVVATPAWAQAMSTQAGSAATSPTPEAQANDGPSADAIVITACKRAETVRDVPVSLLVLGETRARGAIYSD